LECSKEEGKQLPVEITFFTTSVGITKQVEIIVVNIIGEIYALFRNEP
jgi:hypothetical protein